MAVPSFEQLKPALQCGDDPVQHLSAQRALATFLTDVFVAVKENGPDSADDSIKQLNATLKFVMDTYKSGTEIQILTVEIDKTLAKAYAYTFSVMLENANHSFGSGLLDLASQLSDIVTADKKLSMHNNWYSGQKHLAIVVLQFLFDKFNGFLNSYKTAVLTSLYKHLSKCNDNYNVSVEDDLFKANYFTDMVKLIDIIIVNDNGSSLLLERLFSRLLKVSKFVVQKDTSNGAYIYPLPAILHAYNMLTMLLKSDRYVSGLSAKKISSNPNYYIHSIQKHLLQYIDAMDTDHKQFRLSLSKNLADILVFNYVVFGANMGNADSVLEHSITELFSHYATAKSPRIRVGLLEVFVQFIDKMNRYYQTGSVGGAGNFVALQFFKMVSCIYKRVFGLGLEPTKKGEVVVVIDRSTNQNDALHVLGQLRTVYGYLITELDSDVNGLIILAKLVLGSTDSPLQSLSGECTNIWYTLTLLEFASELVAHLGEYILSRQDGISESSHEDVGAQVGRKLFELVTHENESVRTKAVEVLVQITRIEPEFAYTLLKTPIETLSSAFDSKTLNFAQCHGYAFLMASVLTYCPKDYISTDYVLKAFTLSTNFLKRFNSSMVSNNLLGSSGSISIVNYQRQLLSWILMTGLFNYAADENFSDGTLFWIDTTQLLGIWKNLLAHSMPTGFVQVDASGTITNQADIIRLLQIKNYALSGLSSYATYLTSSKSQFTPDSANRLSQLLTKNFTFVHTIEQQLSVVPQGISEMITLNRLRTYETLIKLVSYLDLRADLNSTMLLNLVGNFSNPKEYTSGSTSSGEYAIYSLVDETNYGLTSKINSFLVDELEVKNPSIVIEDKETKPYLQPTTFFDETFESMSQQSFTHSFVHDPVLYLMNGKDCKGYTSTNLYPAPLKTTLVDVSIETFALIFSQLSPKMQQSTIENLRTAVFNKSSTGILRKKAVLINTSVAIHCSLNFMRQSGKRLTSAITDLLVGTLRNFDHSDVYVMSLNSKSIGMACALAESTSVTNQIAITVNSIVEHSDPLSRAFDLETLGSIAKYSTVGGNVPTTLLTLCMDPHPVVHAASLDSLATYLSSQSPTDLDASLIRKVLDTLLQIWISDLFGVHSSTTVACNMSYREHLSSTVLMSTVVRVIVNISGPLVGTWSPQYKGTLKVLLYGLIYLTTDHCGVITEEVIQSMEELLIFDKTLIPMPLYEDYLKFIITNNFYTGVFGHGVSCLPLNNKEDTVSTYELYPYTTSPKLWKSTLESYHQLIKLGGTVTDSMERLMWICLEHEPTNHCVHSILNQLLEDSRDDTAKLQWLDKLIDYFNISKPKLLSDLVTLFKKRIDNGGMFFRPALLSTNSNTESVPEPSYAKESLNGDQEDTLNDDTASIETTDDKQKQTSAAGGASTEQVPMLDIDSERTPWRFRLFVVGMLNNLLSYAGEDEKLKLLLMKRIQDFVRISFVCSTSSIATLRIASLQMLGKIIDLYGQVKDPVYPDASILEQHQAPIVTAIVPAFDRGSNVDLASEAVVLASQLVNSKITPLSRMGRIVKILVSSLESFATQNRLENDDSALKVGDVNIVSLKSQNKMKVHILQAWARMKAGAGTNDEQLTLLLDKYNGVLVPLWIYSLREYATMRYGKEYVSRDATDMDTYENSWIDFLNVLGTVADEDPAKFKEMLGDEVGNFLFVALGRSMEHLIKSPHDTAKVLESLSKLFKLDLALEIILKDLIFPEFVDLLDRIVSTSSDTQTKSDVVELSKNIFESYFKQHEDKGKTSEQLTADVEKLFELIRINTAVASQLLPFLKDKEIDREKLKPISTEQLALLKQSFDSIVDMIGYLPEVMQVDLYSCLLYMFSLIYELNNPETISVLLPTLKRTIGSFEAIAPENENLLNFFSTIKQYLKEESRASLLTAFIIASTLKKLKITDEEADKIANFIVSGLLSEEMASLAIQTVKTLIRSERDGSNGAILAHLIPKLIERNQELHEPRLLVEILTSLAKSLQSEDELEAAYELAIPVLTWFSQLNDGQYKEYVRMKLLDLIKYSPTGFKKYITECDDEQRIKVQQLVKGEDAIEAGDNDDEGEGSAGNGTTSSNAGSGAGHIHLKTFG